MVKDMCGEELSAEEDNNKLTKLSLYQILYSPYCSTSPICQRGDEVMTGTTSRYFCGEGRSGSPFCK